MQAKYNVYDILFNTETNHYYLVVQVNEHTGLYYLFIDLAKWDAYSIKEVDNSSTWKLIKLKET